MVETLRRRAFLPSMRRQCVRGAREEEEGLAWLLACGVCMGGGKRGDENDREEEQEGRKEGVEREGGDRV